MPLLILLLLLIGGPWLEISMFIEVGGRIGTLQAIALTILSAVLGLAIVRVQGLAILGRMQASMSQGEPPVAELVHGFFLLIAGLCLFLPGFVSDGIGVLLLIPPVRAILGRLGLHGLIVARNRPARQPDPSGKLTIEGEYWAGPGQHGEGDSRIGDNSQDDPKTD